MRYNLPSVESYATKLISPLLSEDELNKYENLMIKLPMPNRSLIILYGPPRYQVNEQMII